ncbi:hypothetical protein EYF80_026352 [Liparis tanakae]|uniref:Uncharacterized protein n=1 Tax=Liparis tanakae TaxID=230148 RepID=A0A4Z2HCC2_9TELE|nr:hypothetical protein EYF80_026352 [Liparis tanakae]
MPSPGWLLLALSLAALTGNPVGAVAHERTERNCSLSPPSEYIAPRDARMAFMTGFTGSAGTIPFCLLVFLPPPPLRRLCRRLCRRRPPPPPLLQLPTSECRDHAAPLLPPPVLPKRPRRHHSVPSPSLAASLPLVIHQRSPSRSNFTIRS